MTTSVRALLAFGADHVRLVSERTDAVLDRQIEWIHASDLSDPTPFLEPGQLLLTDGAQFLVDDTDAAVDAYVARLASREIVGIGFGSLMHFGRVPEALVRACAQHWCSSTLSI